MLKKTYCSIVLSFSLNWWRNTSFRDNNIIVNFRILYCVELNTLALWLWLYVYIMLTVLETQNTDTQTREMANRRRLMFLIDQEQYTTKASK